MDSNLWKLNATNSSEFARDVRLTLHNQQADSLALNADGQLYDADPLYNYGDTLSLYKGEVRWFSGIVLSTPRSGSPSAERHDYEVAGLWWYLDQLTFKQDWTALTKPKGHVTLGLDINNDYVSIGGIIKEALDYAIGKGAPFSYIEAELTALSAVPPVDEQTDLTCSEVIRKVLRWVPDVMTGFDYSAATPVLHFTRRASATALQLPCIGDTEQINIRDRSELLKSGVIIDFERVDTVDGEQIPDLQTDLYPLDSVDGFNTASFTINIPGQQIATQSVEVEVEELGDPTGAAFWTRWLPELGNKIGLAVNPDALNLLPLGLDNVLLSGTVPSWTGKTVLSYTLVGELSYTDANGTEVINAEHSVTLKLTDAETKTYVKEVSVTDPDPYPTGLAQMLYEALSVLHWQGSFELIESECTGGVRPGNVLNLTGGLTAWETMNAAIQSVSFDLDSGRTAINFGPPERLGLADYIALLNANRRRITHYTADQRSTGTNAGGAALETSGGTPNNSGGGSPRYQKLVIDDGEDTPKEIEIDATKVAKGKVIVGTSDNKMETAFPVYTA